MPNNKAYQDYLVQRFITVAMEEALPMGISQACLGHIADKVEQGVQIYWDRPDAPVPELRLVTAEGNIRELIVLMKSRAVQMGLAEMSEDTFYGALEKLCPFWPIC